MMNAVINVIITLSLLLVAVAMYNIVEENSNKHEFDIKCKYVGGIPLRYTFHYDKEENKIHYVCLNRSAIMTVE
jgi:hypothetical protein